MVHYTFLQASPLGSGKQKQQLSTTTTQESPPDVGKQQQTPTWTTLLIPVLLMVLFYFFLIRPQQKKEKQRLSMIQKLSKGDKILTKGGIYGVVTEVKTDKQIASVKIADKVNVDIAINSVELLVSDKPKKKG